MRKSQAFPTCLRVPPALSGPQWLISESLHSLRLPELLNGIGGFVFWENQMSQQRQSLGLVYLIRALSSRQVELWFPGLMTDQSQQTTD
jgi:hypothetical protein